MWQVDGGNFLLHSSCPRASLGGCYRFSLKVTLAIFYEPSNSGWLNVFYDQTMIGNSNTILGTSEQLNITKSRPRLTKIFSRES